MTVLEQRYRRLLTLLPAGYRNAWEEDMVETYLSLADDEKPRRRVRMAEAWAVVSLAARLRLTGQSDAAVRWRQAVGYVVLAILLFQFVAALPRVRWYFVDMVWYSYGAPLIYLPGVLFEASTILLCGGAFFALLFRKRRLALGLVVLLAAREAVTMFLGSVSPAWSGFRIPPYGAVYLSLAVMLAAGIFLIYRREMSIAGRRGWLIAVPVTWGAIVLLRDPYLHVPFANDGYPLLDGDVWALGAGVVMALTLLRLAFGKPKASHPLLLWANAAPVLAGIAIAAECWLLVTQSIGSDWSLHQWPFTGAQAVILVVLAVALRLRVRQIRRRSAAVS